METKEIQCGNLAVEKGTTSSINGVLAENASFFIKKADSSNIVQNVSFKENLKAPIEKGDIVGNVNYTLNGEVIKSINIVSDNSIKEMGLLNMTLSTYKNWFKMLR